VRLVSLKTATLRAEQSSLTGEPVAVLKGLEPTADANCELQVCESVGAHLCACMYVCVCVCMDVQTCFRVMERWTADGGD
jgi:hypothetical protein